MNREEFNIIALKAIQESWDKMYKEMTDNPIKKLMFWYASKWWPM